MITEEQANDLRTILIELENLEADAILLEVEMRASADELRDIIEDFGKLNNQLDNIINDDDLKEGDAD